MKALMTSKEAAEYLGYAHDTMRQSRVSGELGGLPAPAHINIGRTIRYKIEELDEWIEALTAGGAE